MKKTAHCLLALALLAMPVSLWAQDLNISGRVTDSNNEPVVGATVVVKGTSTGASTGINGDYNIVAPANATLVFSFIGMTPREEAVNDRTRVDVSLGESSHDLDEVVVVGYGTMKRSDLSGSSVSVGESQIKGSVITNIDQALQGRASGVTSVMTSGAPGSAVSIRVRGNATVKSGAEPLYVVDGVIFQGSGSSGPSVGLGDALGNGNASAVSPLATLNPSDILSMEILKDASATAIYGAQGANGVILITTKRGKAGEAKFSYDVMTGIQEQTIRLDMMNLRQYATYSNALAQTTATTQATSGTPEYRDPSLLGAGTDWQEAIFRPAFMQQHTVAAQGGTDKVQYFVSGSFMNQEGTILGTEFSRYSVRTNLDAQLKKWLKIGMNTSYTSTDENLGLAEGEEGVLTLSLQTPPDIPVYDAEGNYATMVREGYTRRNPIAKAELDQNTLGRSKLNGNIFAEVNPLKGLSWHTELGYDISSTQSERWRPTYYFGPIDKRDKNSVTVYNGNNLYWQVKNYVTYQGEIGKHSFSAMLGQEAWESSWKNSQITTSGLPDNTYRNPNLGTDPQISSGYGSTAMASFFARGTYNYDDRYLGTYTYRYDGSSNFGPENRWAGFHAFAVSWKFTNEQFVKDLNIDQYLSNGKVRVGWGQTGNSNIGGFRWGASLSPMPSALGQGYKQSNIANPYVQWETQVQWNLGLDVGFLKNRINLVLDLYDKTSEEMLMDLQLPSYMGTRGNSSSALGAPMGNYGTINNKGLEITLNTQNLVGDFTWETDFQISFNKNKLVALDGSAASAIEGYGQWSDVVSRSQVGEPLYGFYGYVVEGVYQNVDEIKKHRWAEVPENGVYSRYNTVFVGDLKFADLNGDGKIDTEDRTTIGSPLPKFTYGMTNTFTYKNFDLSLFLHGSYGNKVFNNIDRMLTGMGSWSNQLSKVMGYAQLGQIDDGIAYPRNKINAQGETYTVNNWFEDADNVKILNPGGSLPRADQNDPADNDRLSSRYIEDGSYLRIKNIILVRATF